MKSSLKKGIVLLLVLTLSIGIFTGCTNKDDDFKETENETTIDDGEAVVGDKQEEKISLTLLVDRDQDLSGIEAVAEAIEKELNIETVIDLRPGAPEGDNIVKTRLATGDMADLCFYNSGALFQTLNPSEHFVDLTNEGFIKDLDDSFKEAVSVDGKVYGIPTGSYNAGVWFYNKDIYSELGLEVPHTWTELMENCEKIKQAGKTPVIGGFKDTWTSQMVVLADYYNVSTKYPEFHEDFTNNKAKFATTPAALRGFEKLAEIYEKGYMNDDFNSTSYDMAMQMLAEGEGVHWPMLTFALPVIATNYPDAIDSIGSFGQPGDDAENHGVTLWLPAGIYIYNRSENVDAAKLWCEYFISQKGIEIMETKIKPTGPYAIKGIEISEDTYEAVKDLIPYIEEGKTAPALEFLSPLKGPNLPQITQECGSGMITPQEAAEKYDEDVKKQAKQLGIPGW